MAQTRDNRTISQFKSRLLGGGARPNLFEVELTNLPASVTFPWQAERFGFLCKAAQLPAQTIANIDVPFRGRIFKVAGDRTIENWTITIINDEDMIIRNAVEQWSNSINSHLGNLRSFGSASPGQYKANASITHFGKTGLPLRTYTFNGLFPTEVSPIDLDWNTTDTLEEFTVTFQYDHWEVGGITGNAGGN